MFEREIRELAFVPRWSIVRTNRQQYLAEHTYFVCMYANDICVWLGLDFEEIGIVLQLALWHDVEEIFSGDIPGPCKRSAMTKDARDDWGGKMTDWKQALFERLEDRDGIGGSAQYPLSVGNQFDAIVKLADMLDECCEMGTELQMGNQTVEKVFEDSLQRVKNAVASLRETYAPDSMGDWDDLMERCVQACLSARHNQSRSTTIFDTL